ncbi:MAG: ribosomal L7Ae/L30e/S12e/Gadd45 family protein [Bacteroides sp.]|nr:ribosomal L7Ae/L30e/S12e/Gadd45 family protein [Eubacterium sp.]MCM1419737.1 ribosomal L7Ae/L30e/S12e/Gadd45 family protein [Roseburia sp.]MCM1463725.1 ribosomal L7Ae/L30e/S12e/Gadd45 family protein [Bacteroides sp.]
MKRALGTLGLCRKAGKLIYGFDSVTEEIKKPKNTVGGVVLADDLSEKSKKEVRYVSDKYGVAVALPGVTMDELKSVTGKHTGIVAILDKGLFRAITDTSNKPEKTSVKLGDIE